IAEARQFFTSETRKVLASPGLVIGRTLENPGRLKNIEENGGNPLDLIRQKLIDSHAGMVTLLNEMSDDALLLDVEHVAYGELRMDHFLQRFMVGHDKGHIEQSLSLFQTH
ncbi:MAG: hypothetical protein AAF485_29625, partial [Chloroflexota bacterium]